MRKVTFTQAITEAVDEELARDPNVIVMGEDVRIWGAPLGEYTGLYDKYGSRVKDTPISETAILGGAIGAAATGLRPIAHIMFVDFCGVCGDELLNQLQMRYMYGGKAELPLTIMSYCGAGIGAAAQHSKTLYGWLLCVQGLRIVAAATPYDAKGLLKSAIREDNPVMFLQHKMLIFGTAKQEVPDEEYTIPLGKADIKREGSDVTVVAIQFMVQKALAAAEELKQYGISIEVVDPRTLDPLDKETILRSVKKTGRLVVLSEEPVTGSAAGEIVAIVADEGHDYLKAPIKRVCAPDTPIPFGGNLEKFWMPDEKKLVQAVTELVRI
jgi:pyruvate/2-oxoglutarate/acetoin dehydrogenase E1 component